MVHLRFATGDLTVQTEPCGMSIGTPDRESQIVNRKLSMPLARLALLFAVFLFTAGLQDPTPDEPPPFDQWRQELMTEARARGYSEELIQEALASIEPLQRVITNDRSQAEAVVGFDRYYRTRVTPQIVRQGRELARQHGTVLAGIEAAYGVQRRVVVAIWGHRDTLWPCHR